MTNKLVAAGLADRQRPAVDADLAAAVEDRPDASRPVRPGVWAHDVLALRLEHRSLDVLRAQRLVQRRLDSQQLLDRALGLRVCTLAEVALEQHSPLIEQIASGPAKIPVELPDLELGVDH